MTEPQQCTCTGTNAGLNACTNCPTPWPDIPGADRMRQYPDERRERAEADMLSVLPEPEDTCRPVEVDGETIRVRGAEPLSEEGQAAVAALVRAARAKMAAEPPHVRQQIRAAAFNAVAPALRRHDEWLRLTVRRTTADAVLNAIEEYLDFGDAEAWCKSCRRVWDGRHHRCESDAEAAVARVQALAAAHPVTIDTALIHEALDEPARTTPNNSAGPCPACRRADQAGLAPDEQHPGCRTMAS